MSKKIIVSEDELKKLQDRVALIPWGHDIPGEVTFRSIADAANAVADIIESAEPYEPEDTPQAVEEAKVEALAEKLLVALAANHEHYKETKDFSLKVITSADTERARAIAHAFYADES